MLSGLSGVPTGSGIPGPPPRSPRLAGIGAARPGRIERDAAPSEKATSARNPTISNQSTIARVETSSRAPRSVIPRCSASSIWQSRSSRNSWIGEPHAPVSNRTSSSVRLPRAEGAARTRCPSRAVGVISTQTCRAGAGGQASSPKSRKPAWKAGLPERARQDSKPVTFGFVDRAGDSAGLRGGGFQADPAGSDSAAIGWAPCGAVSDFVPHDQTASARMGGS